MPLPPRPPPPRPKSLGPAKPDPAIGRSRARGALLGLAVGDALGTTNQGKLMNTPDFSVPVIGMQTEMLGGGPFKLIRGQVTDVTQLACCIANGLKALGRYDEADILDRYQQWEKASFFQPPEMKNMLEHLRDDMLPRVASHDAWIQAAKRPASLCALVRTLPLGVFFAKDRTQRLRATLDDASLTDWDPRVRLACVAFNGAIASALTQIGDVDPKRMVTAALGDLTAAAALAGKEMKDDVREVQRALGVVREDLAAAQEDDPLLYGPDLFLAADKNSVRIPFRAGFWHLFHTPSASDALIDLVNRGGDANCNAAIAGALLGARYGEAAFPEDWTIPVMDALFNKLGPLWEEYHPRVLLTLVD